MLPVSSYLLYFQLSAIESWLNIANCIVNRTILFAPRQITISHYRTHIDHKSLIPSPPVIIKFIFNLIKSMYWIITVALIVSGFKTCFFKSWVVHWSCNSAFALAKRGESWGQKWSDFQAWLSGCSVCGGTWQLMNLLQLSQSAKHSQSHFPCIYLYLCLNPLFSALWICIFSLFVENWSVLGVVRTFISSVQILEILDGLQVSALMSWDEHLYLQQCKDRH